MAAQGEEPLLAPADRRARSGLSPQGVAADPGSFRDPDSRVFVGDEGVYRALSASGLEDWQALKASSTWSRFHKSGALVATEECAAGEVPAALESAGESPIPGGVAAVLRHERIPFVSYPYEWSFAMLRDAALLQLELMLSALDDGLILKDASPYNVQFRGSTPVFVDVGSFERLREGAPWVGYRQFCSLFLNPLLLQAYKGIPFQRLLRGSVEGISPSETDAYLSLRDHFRKGVLSHVHLHARLEERNAARAGAAASKELKDAGFNTELIRNNVSRLHKLVSRLEWDAGATAWSGYRDANTYTETTASAKGQFVAEAVRAVGPALVWDVGANDGAYSRIAVREGAGSVLALDLDHATIDALYRALSGEGDTKILPLVANLTDPSPGLGWRGRERRVLEDRGKPELALCLAVVHHLTITGNLPLAEVIDWMRSLDAALVVEFPPRDDEMVRVLLSGKEPDANPDYELENFERLLAERFEVERREQLSEGGRVLFFARPR